MILLQFFSLSVNSSDFNRSMEEFKLKDADVSSGLLVECINHSLDFNINPMIWRVSRSLYITSDLHSYLD